MKILKHTITSFFLSPLAKFLSDSRSIGFVLIACTLFSLVVSNIPVLQTAYLQLWNFNTTAYFFKFNSTLLMWVNDGFMTIFFLLIGMEIKRELTIGELSSIQQAAMPIFAAIGGMLFPAIIFTVINHNTPFQKGWAIPMATDIAFSLGVLSLLGKRVPIQLKIFLMALSIIDDLGAVITIAFFYSAAFNWVYLLGAIALTGLLLVLQKLRLAQQPVVYIIFGCILWYCLLQSGIHPTISGVVVGFCLPFRWLAAWEHKLFIPVNFLVMPLFVLANTAIVFPSSPQNVVTSTIAWGIVAGLCLGKPLGIFIFSYGSHVCKLASKSTFISWKQLIGVGLIAGIGFTMSIFTATLSYAQLNLQTIAKISIVAASVLSGSLGYWFLLGSGAKK